MSVENERLRVTVLPGGGHIAEVYEKSAGVSALWIPPWKSIDPPEFDRLQSAGYGDGDDNKLLTIFAWTFSAARRKRSAPPA